jgi:Zn-finger nucleic acid-binding protein
MADAGVLRCPACGAGVTEGTRRCAHCAAPVSTVRCATCFHMNAPDAVHCSGCGRDLGLEPIGRGDTLECPDCHLAMAAFDCGPGALHDCGRCGGQFVEHAALRDLLERHDRTEVPLAGPRSRAGQADTRVRYVACPVCKALMNRKNFGGGSRVIVDVCAKHGTWFDDGELPRVLAYVESGGLARARRQEEEAREREKTERIDAVLSVGRLTSSHDPYASSAEAMVAVLLSDLFGGGF